MNHWWHYIVALPVLVIGAAVGVIVGPVLVAIGLYRNTLRALAPDPKADLEEAQKFAFFCN